MSQIIKKSFESLHFSFKYCTFAIRKHRPSHPPLLANISFPDSLSTPKKNRFRKAHFFKNMTNIFFLQQDLSDTSQIPFKKASPHTFLLLHEFIKTNGLILPTNNNFELTKGLTEK
jgi:hypothetical protein